MTEESKAFAHRIVPKIHNFIKKILTNKKREDYQAFFECLIWNAFAPSREDYNIDVDYQELESNIEYSMKTVLESNRPFSEIMKDLPITKAWGEEAGFPDIGELRLEPDIIIGVDGDICIAIQIVGGFKFRNYYSGDTYGSSEDEAMT